MIPSVIRCLTDAERIRPHAGKLGLADANIEVLREAVTPPQATAGIDYQRFETLGDRVLQLCTTVHVYYKFLHKDEGKLHVLRRNSVCNRYLRRRAEEAGLTSMICFERLAVAKWQWPDTEMDTRAVINRKWLQDSTEALLGVAYETGGWLKAFVTGQALGLPFGGTEPWTKRYSISVPYELDITSDVAEALQRKLGYRFKNQQLLLEAITHPSLASQDVPSYNRLEFLGDAILDMIVVERMFHKFPHADPSELTRRKQAIVSNATLGWLSAMDMFEGVDAEALLNEHWEYHPAKLLADVVESVIGAIFVDLGHDYEKTKKSVIPLIEKVLQDSDRPQSTGHHEYRITVHGKTLATRQGAHRYSIKCSLSVDALTILREKDQMLNFCNCDVENLEKDGLSCKKRKAKDEGVEGEPAASRACISGTPEVAMVFDYKTHSNSQDDVNGAGHHPGMNAVGYTVPSDAEILKRMPLTSEEMTDKAIVKPLTKEVKKQQSFYVEDFRDDILVDDDVVNITKIEKKQSFYVEDFGDGILVDDDVVNVTKAFSHNETIDLISDEDE
ncbi:hypothetical protein QFC19_005774 [Naganishia cerealis]|uniref:Uncharacterized protein n=1 Tax=Naganishia cerealis TaxID=610337 RepID=A0ACC2VM76_9TREE|nr:hypothetical protein QFC19_005774 [Naganishia cerealis]